MLVFRCPFWLFATLNVKRSRYITIATTIIMFYCVHTRVTMMVICTAEESGSHFCNVFGSLYDCMVCGYDSCLISVLVLMLTKLMIVCYTKSMPQWSSS